MNRIDYSKKWIISFLCTLLMLAIFVCSSIFIIDPFFQFRVRDNQYFMNVAYVDAGLIKNYDYDTIIIGSCMVENYDIEEFNDLLNVNALKIGCSGLGSDGVVRYNQLANEVGKAENYYINVDLSGFEVGKADEDIGLGQQREINVNEYDYLLSNDPLSKLKYMFSYEAWFRFVPVDMGLVAYRLCKGDISGGKLGARTSVAHNGEWSEDYVYGEKAVMENRKDDGDIEALDKEEQEELLQRMIKNIDDYMGSFDFSNGNYTFIFPPYSYLFWEDAKLSNRYDIYNEAKDYLVDWIKQNGGEVYDFQNADVTYDLNYYMDTIHYSKDLNSYMIQCMARGEHKR